MALEYLEYLSNSGSNPKQLVIMLHGYGSDASDLISMAPEIAEYLPHAHFIAPFAPFKCEEDNSAYQWFSLVKHEDQYMTEGAKNTAPILNRFIDSQIEKFNLTSQEVALIGFSQGTMMSLYTALRREHPIKAVLAYSGMLLSPHLLKDEIKSQPKVMLIHGTEDHILPHVLMDMAYNTLKNAGVECQTASRPGLAHGIDRHGIDVGGSFLSEVFNESQDLKQAGYVR